MTRIIAAPFRKAGTHRLQLGPWQLHDGDCPSDLPSALPHWDFNTNLTLSRWIDIDLDGFRKDCGLDCGERLRVVIAWRASGTALRGRAAVVNLPSAEPRWQGPVELVLDGHELGGTVEISTQVILANAVMPVRPLTAHLPGSVLWEEAWNVAVEGQASRFPVEIIDFAGTTWAPSRAGWYLSWNSDDLHRPFLGNVRLYVNAQHPRVAAAVKAPNANAENRSVVSAVFFDVGRALLMGVLGNDEFLEDPDRYPEGSTGRAVWRMMRAVFPTDSPTTLRNRLSERPAYFDAVLQQQLKLFED